MLLRMCLCSGDCSSRGVGSEVCTLTVHQEFLGSLVVLSSLLMQELFLVQELMVVVPLTKLLLDLVKTVLAAVFFVARS